MEQLMLLQGVHEVSLLADPSAPTEVSQRAFDAARAGSAFPDLPPARNIARLLGVGWGEVLGLAHEPEEVRAHRLGRKRPSAELVWLDDGYVAFALRAVALRLGTRSLSLAQYDAERQRMLAADRVRWLHGRALSLPNGDQVITRVGSWPKALRLAGLERSPAGKGQQGPPVPTLVDLLERFHAHYKAEPRRAELLAFAAGNGIQHPRVSRAGHAEGLAAWRAKRAAEGLPAPAPPAPMSERPDHSRDVGAARPGELRRAKRRSAEDCIAWMRRYLEGLPAGARSTQRSYREWARACAGAPAPGTFEQHGGFSRVRSLAQERMRADARG